ncbi:type II toxin-antitoxin system RelE/ParE family toxin [Membranihabitans marinus]|uniref:type II toxin-antitoxin system RelE/ParE family toxin n=1 Tax=Membranihabitans marinus TaxID=1227546 RepID=UPI00293E171A|nr:type II toxin-antitoxin system RelE/ParE family toxin [Membranihabitans marinus]
MLFNIDRAKIKTDNRLFKKLHSDIWEFRTWYNRKQYRLFAFWDKTDSKVIIVIATHGIIKKGQKTPIKDIDKAVKLKNKYSEYKNKKNKRIL